MTEWGVTIALYGDTGCGKTTQIGQYAKDKFKRTGKITRYYSGDLGGYGSIKPLVKKGIIEIIPYEEGTDPWLWIANAAEGRGSDGQLFDERVGAAAFDSGTSISEAILNAITKADFKVGQQNTQKFVVTRGERSLSVGLNNEAHYGLVQSFMLDQIWKSTWLTRRGLDVIWTFSVDRAERSDATPIVGPKLAGHALTSQIPKWFNYTFRLASIPVAGAPARHLLYLQEQPDLGGVGMSFGNARYPLEAVSELPAVIEPANLAEALELIRKGEHEAEETLERELERMSSRG